MPRLPVRWRTARRRKRPLPFRERLRRFWRDLRAFWPLWLGVLIYTAVLFIVAIDPLVDPFMPERGRHKLLAAIPLSYRLLKGDIWDFVLFVLIWLPWLTLLALVPKFPRWLREHREWERKAVIRREREKAKRARRRAEREAANDAESSRTIRN